MAELQEDLQAAAAHPRHLQPAGMHALRYLWMWVKGGQPFLQAGRDADQAGQLQDERSPAIRLPTVPLRHIAHHLSTVRHT